MCVCCDNAAEVDKHGVESSKASSEAVTGYGKSDERSRHMVCVNAVLCTDVKDVSTFFMFVAFFNIFYFPTIFKE